MRLLKRLWRRFFGRQQDEGIPAWYDSRLRPGPAPDGQPVFLYMPWIPEHGDALIAKIERGGGGIRFHPLDIVRDSDDVGIRLSVLVYAQENPDRWRRLVMRKLAPLARQVAGFVVSFDWHPVMREIVFACRSLGIPTLLVPHESVFIDEDRYYVARNGASVPATDYAMVWGQMQRRIFTERGYPDERILVTGSPKFDIFHRYRPQLDREGFASIFGLDPERPILLFAGQPLDSQVDSQRFAIARQAQAIADLLDVAEEIGAQVVIRQPPARKVIVGKPERERIEASVDFAIDGPVKFAVSPEEALFHANAILSVNSTMLFEAVLMGRPSISMPYFEFEQIWQKLDIARAPNREDLRRLLLEALDKGEPMVSAAGMTWARRELSAAEFDGKAAERVAAAMREIALTNRGIQRRHAARLVAEGTGGRGSIACISTADALPAVKKPLMRLLGAKSVIPATVAREVAGADYFLRFDSRFAPADPVWHRLRRDLGRSELYVERGFLPPPPGADPAGLASIVIDEVAPYHEVDRETGLIRRLNRPDALEPAAAARAEAAMARLRAAMPTAARSSEPRRILVVDQLCDDCTLPPEEAGEGVLAGILRACVKSYPDAEVVIGRERLSRTGSDWILDTDLVGRVCGTRRIPVIEAGPDGQLPLAGFDEIHVATSEVGFLGLVAGVPVHCHRACWYSGWGLTRDHVAVRHRMRGRTVTELFHVAWIEASRYFDAASGKRVEIEALLPPEPVASRPAAEPALLPTP